MFLNWRGKKEDPDTSRDSEGDGKDESTVYISDDESVHVIDQSKDQENAENDSLLAAQLEAAGTSTMSKAGGSGSGKGKTNPADNMGDPEDPMDANGVFNAAPGETPDDTRLRRSWAGTRGHITRQLKRARSIIDACPNNQATNAMAMEQARACGERLRKLLEDLETKNDAVIDRMPGRSNSYVRYITEAHDEVQPLADMLASIRPPRQEEGGTPQHQADHDQAGRAEGNVAAAATTAIRPPTLTFDNSPSEFREWKERLVAYFMQANIINVAPDVQQTYFYPLLDAKVAAQVRAATDRDLLVMDRNDPQRRTCMSQLERVFEQRNPVTLRRRRWLEHKRKPNERYADWLAKLIEMMEESDVDNFGADELRVFSIISNVSDPQLEKEITELRNQHSNRPSELSTRPTECSP